MIGDWLKIWDVQGDHVIARADEAQSVDAALTSWVTSGKTNDRVIHVELLNGATLIMLASSVMALVVSTPESRRRDMEIDKAMQDEEREIRHALGIWEE